MTKLDEERPLQSTEEESQLPGCQDGGVSPLAEACDASPVEGTKEPFAEANAEEARDEPLMTASVGAMEITSVEKEKVGNLACVGVPVRRFVQDDRNSMPVDLQDSNQATQDCVEDKQDDKRRLAKNCEVLRGLEVEEAKIIQKQHDGLNIAKDEAPGDELLDDVLATIQPLPPSRSEGVVSILTRPGAFASTPPLHELNFRADGMPPHVDAGRLEITDTGIAGTRDELVEAELVEEGDYVVNAEQLNRCGVTKRTSIICWGQLLVIVALVVTLSAVLIPGKSSTSNVSLDADMDDGMSGNRFPCIESTDELWDALDAYYIDNSPSANVSQHYGWPIGQWCVSEVRVFFKAFKPERSGFSEANTYFHEDVGSWDMSNALELEQTMRGCQNVSASWGIQNWDTGSVTNIQELFMRTSWTEPALDLSRWNTSSMWNMGQVFRGSDVTKANISSWNTSNVLSLSQFASNAKNFTDDLSNWDVSNVGSLNKAFEDASSFNSDLSRWNTRSLANLNAAFNGAASFNQDISQWDVKKVTSMMQVFARSAFNQDISGWNVSSVNEIRWAFSRSSFNQNLCAWGNKLSPHLNTTDMFKNTPCPNTSDPVIPGGPFCYNCNE